MRIFNEDGTPRTNYINVSEVTDGTQDQPSLTVLSNGYIVVGWSNGSSLTYQAYTPEGVPVASNYAVGGSVVEAEITALAGGEIANVRASTIQDAGGGGSDDTYVVDNAGDSTVEAAGSGTDLMQSMATFTLASNVENLALNGATAIDGTGNASANTMFGNSAANRLDGNGGSDTMTGFGGADVFVFDDGDGSDTITDFANGTDTFDLTAVAGVNDFSALTVIDNGATVTVDYGTGSFTVANVANPALIDANDIVFA